MISEHMPILKKKESINLQYGGISLLLIEVSIKLYDNPLG